MDYKNGIDILPKELVVEIQKYISGGLVYIPQIEENKKQCGELSGYKVELKIRNDNIKDRFLKGSTIEELSLEYCLSIETIKKIVYRK
ncbi:CD3324 family protein [Clostridium sp. C8-1-8]|uniref:CD3324 family protein n=1 Tax=Clostridium sp. C8-1-8 TaxID=2698831 RepID=UPI0013696B8D|nr:CD3324 family protein [Clostridium sp. C8-1-8]